MKAKEELEKLQTDKALIDSKREELIRLDSLAKKMTAAVDGEAVSRSRNLDPMGTVIAQKNALANDIAKLQADYDNRKANLTGIIASLKNPIYIKILYGLYFNGKKPGEIAKAEGYCTRNIYYLRDNALLAVEKLL